MKHNPFPSRPSSARDIYGVLLAKVENYVKVFIDTNMSVGYWAFQIDAKK